MVNRHIKEKKHRLPLYCYKGQIRVTFTICIQDKKTFFVEKGTVDKFIEILRETMEKHNSKNWVYIFMPDHLHVVNEGLSDNSDLWKMITFFKQKTGYWLAQNKKEIRWQKDFYDYIHRREDDLKKHLIYILNNQVRKGLVSDWRKYPFKGSLDFNLEEIVS